MKQIVNKIIATLTIIYILSLVVLPINVSALNFEDKIIADEKYYSAAYKEYLKLSDEEKSKLGVIPNMYDVPLNIDLFNTYKASVGANSEESIPVSYVLTSNDVDKDGTADINVSQYGNLPMKIKDQENYNICWAFASLNSLETNLALHGYRDPNGELWDYSELYIDYLGVNGIEGTDLEDRELHSGGNFYHFLNTQAQGYGNVLETEVPYHGTYSYEYLESLYPRAQVSEYVMIPTMDKFNNQVLVNGEYCTLNDELINLVRNLTKKHIMENGSLFAMINSEDMVWSSDKSKIVLNSKSLAVDHAVSIIGWDDNYSRNNFPESCRPNSNGAFIAMNSWGDNLGVNNVFYISYEDYLVEAYLSGVRSAFYMSIANSPSQTRYFEGESFNPSGMKILAHYQNETTEDITDECTFKTEPLQIGEESINIIYTTKMGEKDISFILSEPITVNKFKAGDINRDTNLTLYDAFTMLRKVITEEKLSEMDKKIMDYNGDNNITLYDAFSFLRTIIQN